MSHITLVSTRRYSPSTQLPAQPAQQVNTKCSRAQTTIIRATLPPTCQGQAYAAAQEEGGCEDMLGALRTVGGHGGALLACGNKRTAGLQVSSKLELSMKGW